MRRFQHVDPLPEVAPALLNAGDIYDYARITGMIYPFERDKERLKEKLKPASYEIDFLGTVYLVNDKGVRDTRGITRDSPFTLPMNSIAFVSLATTFLLRLRRGPQDAPRDIQVPLAPSGARRLIPFGATVLRSLALLGYRSRASSHNDLTPLQGYRGLLASVFDLPWLVA